MLNHKLFQKLKLTRIGKFNHLILSLTRIANFADFLQIFAICGHKKGNIYIYMQYYFTLDI